MRAAVLHAPHTDMAFEDVDIDGPAESEVLVRVVASGVCHSDLHVVEGLLNTQLPAVLGHEAAGIVEAVGSGVTEFAPGDRVIACLSVFCGTCQECLTGRPNICSNRPQRAASESPRLSMRGELVTQFALLGGYAEQMLVDEHSLVKLEQDIELDRAALIGCGITTGVGAVLNTAKIEPGCTVAIIGVGGVGLAAVQGARIGGARQIIAVDVHESKLATARELGATHVVDASSRDPVQAIVDMTGGGVDYSFEAIGLPETAAQAYECLRAGGTATVVGVLPAGSQVVIDGSTLLREKTLQGCSMGSNRFRVDMPVYIDFYLQGRLRLDEMITRRGRLEDLNEAFRAMKAGEVARQVLMFD